MIGYIYKTTNLINKKIYIGQHTADKFDTNYLGSGLLITKAINEYGKANFKAELLCWCDSSTELNEKEKYYIKLFNSTDKTIGYNISNGGQDGCFTGQHHTEEDRLKIGQASKDRIWIYNTDTKKRLFIKKDLYDNYDRNVWVLGHNLNSFANKTATEMAEIGKKISENKKGKYYFTNKLTGECRFIAKEQIEEFVNNGFWYGNRDFPKSGFIWLTDGQTDFKVYSRDAIGQLLFNFNLIPGRSTTGHTWSSNEPVFNLPISIITRQLNTQPDYLRKTKPIISHKIIDQNGDKRLAPESIEAIRQARYNQQNLSLYHNKGKKFYNNGIDCKLFVPGEEPDGYVLGRLLTEDIRQKLSANTAQRNKSRKGKLVKIAVIKDGVTKIIGAKNLDKYLALGYAIHQKGEKDGE